MSLRALTLLTLVLWAPPASAQEPPGDAAARAREAAARAVEAAARAEEAAARAEAATAYADEAAAYADEAAAYADEAAAYAEEAHADGAAHPAIPSTASATPEEATHEEGTHEEATHEEATHEEATHEEATPEEADRPPEPPAYRPYSIPWLLRPLPPVTVLRLDQSFALHDAYGPDPSVLRFSMAQVATLGVRATSWLSILMRQGWAVTSDGDVAGSTFLIGANFAALLTPTLRLSVFLGHTVPEGGNNGDRSNRAARLTRLAMENALWLPNDLAGVLGAGFGWIDAGWTVQVEATLFVLAGLNPEVDEAIVNTTFGLQVGYFVIPQFSLSGEIHHQHFLSSPAILSRGPPADFGAEHQSQTSATLGMRAHVQIEGSTWFRPGLSWGAGFDAPLSADAWQVIQLDLPFIF